MVLIVERGEEEKDVLGDLRRVRTAKFVYRLTTEKRTLGQRAPTRRGGESREFRQVVCSIHLEQGVYQRLFLFHATVTLAL